MALNKPPINTTADSIAGKGWLNDAYRQLQSGILVPGGGVITAPTFSSRRNLVVNGDFMINQRFPALSTFLTQEAGILWMTDRWAFIGSATPYQLGGTVPVSSYSNPINGFDTCFYLSAIEGNTSTGLGYLAQAIESKKIQEIAGLPVTLSFWAKCGSTFSSTYWANQTFNGATGTVMAIMQTGTGVDEGTFAAYTGSTYLPSCGFTPNQYWQFYSVTGTIPVTAKEMKVYFQLNKTNVAFSGQAYVLITGVQLEVGTRATAYDKIPFEQSLRECQRFYEKSFDYAVTPGPTTNDVRGAIFYKAQVASTTAGWDAPTAFKVRKAKDPTMTAYCINNAGAPTDWWNFTRNAVSGVSAFAGVGEQGFVARNPQIAADVVGNEIGLHWNASADI